MTRDDHRAKCIKAFNDVLSLHGAHSLISPFLATELLDSLATVPVRVNPIEATSEQVKRAADEPILAGVIAEHRAWVGAKMAEIARLRKAHDDLLCSAKLAVYFMDQARTPFEMRMAVVALKEAIAEAES